ncbi:MAG: hypothetical protein WEA84_00800 [Rhodovibrionaceae bacterium]
METTERIVEAYVRYVKGWATIPNIRCEGQNEIDLLAIDPKTLGRYHIEVSISISQNFRQLTGKPYDREQAKQRVQQATQRRTVGFFAEKKFASPGVIKRLADYGFEPGNYSKVVVTWGWDDDAAQQADEAGILLWDFRRLVAEIAEEIKGSSAYFADDTLRTLNLFIHAEADAKKAKPPAPKETPAAKPAAASKAPPPTTADGAFWVYENWTHNYAAVHRASCSFCNDGQGAHPGSGKSNGEWLGPFDSLDAAQQRAVRTKRQDIRRCGICIKVGEAG